MKSTLRRMAKLQALYGRPNLDNLRWEMPETALRQLADEDLELLVEALDVIKQSPELTLSTGHWSAIRRWQAAI